MSETLHCVNHPSVETYLRCNRCGKPICTKCAVRTPVGYRCVDCVRAQQRTFFEGFGLVQYLVVAAVSLPLSVIAGWLVPALGWFAVFLGPLAGSAISQAAHWAVKRRRGRYTWLIVCGSIALGALLAHLVGWLNLFPTLAVLGGYRGGLGGLLWLGVYLVTAVGAAYAWLRPGRRV